MSASSLRRQLLAKVHVAAKQLRLTEDVYRLVLQRVTGQDSARLCTDAQLVAVLEEFQRLGWQPPQRPTPDQAGAPQRAARRRSGKPQTRMIWALWNDMAAAGLVKAPTRAALRSFVMKLAGVSDPEWLSVRQASDVIEALKAWREREASKATGEVVR